MQSYIRLLRQFVHESRYVIDERAVAEAILTRAMNRLTADRAEVQNHLARLGQPRARRP
jgi:hypothetical protein